MSDETVKNLEHLMRVAATSKRASEVAKLWRLVLLLNAQPNDNNAVYIVACALLTADLLRLMKKAAEAEGTAFTAQEFFNEALEGFMKMEPEE